MKKILKKYLVVVMILSMFGQIFAVAVSDNDGSAFISKAEFDSLKNTFQSQINQYNTSIDSKIDNAIANYLSGIKVQKTDNRRLIYSGLRTISSLDLNSEELKWHDLSPAGMWSVDVIGFQAGNVTSYATTFDDNYTDLPGNGGYDYWIRMLFEPNGWAGRGGLISGLNKANNTAVWEGFSKKITGWLINTNTYGLNSLSIRANPESGNEEATWERQTQWYALDLSEDSPNLTGRCVLYTRTRASGLGMERSHYLRSYDEKYENIDYINTIIWNSCPESNFVPKDEVLGFGNINPYKDNTAPKISFTNKYDYSAYFCIRQRDTSVSTSPVELRHSGRRTRSVVFPSDSVYSNSLVFPGKRFADSYITNYNQLISKNIVNPTDNSSMYLYQGLPLCVANADEQIEWPVRFTDSGTYEIVASLKPFDDAMSNDKDWINLSVDKTNWSKRALISNGSGTIYFDFKEHGKASNNSTIYVKWHKSDSSSMYNGGGTLDLMTESEVTVTRTT